MSVNSSKALKKLGITTEQLVETFLGPRRGELRRDEADIFWDAFSPTTPASATKASTFYLSNLLTTMMDVLDDTKQLGFPLQAILNTIQFANLFLPLKPEAMTNVLDRWRDNRQKYGRVCPAADEVMRTFLKRQIEKDEALEALTIQTSNLHSLEEFTKLMDVVGYPVVQDEEVRPLSETASNYIYLRDHFTSRAKQRALLDIVVAKMRTLPQQLKINPRLSISSFLVFRHMIIQALSSLPINDTTFLTQVFPLFEQYFLWPRPYGDLAFEVLSNFRRELMAPGYHLRQRFHSEAAMLPMLDVSGKRSYPIYYLVDSGCPSASNWCNLIGAATQGSISAAVTRRLEEKEEVVDQTELRPGVLPRHITAALLLNIFSNDGLASDQLRNSVVALKPELLNSFYSRALSSLNDLIDGKVEESKTSRVTSLNALVAELVRTASDASNVTDTVDLEVADEFAPVPTPFVHILVPQSLSYSSLPIDQIEALGSTPCVSTPFADDLNEILEQHASAAPENGPAEVRLCIGGGANVLHSVLCAYLHLRQSKPDLLARVSPKFYLLPFTSNPLANFLARHDSWYNRHTFIPFRTDHFILPRIAAGNSSNGYTYVPGTPLSRPGMLYRSLVEMYVREAAIPAAVRLYKCEAWSQSPLNSNLGALCDQVIPFASRVDIGFSAPRPNVVAPSLRVQYARCDLNGNIDAMVLDESLSYQHLIVSNIPVTNDLCVPANPTAAPLQMYAFLTEAAKVKQRIRSTRAHVMYLDICTTNPEQLFNVTLDGQSFGPFYRLVISAWNENESQVTLPLMTYFPLDV